MAQHRYLFSTRVPGPESDSVMCSRSRHVIVVSPQGHYYALPLRTLQAGEDRLLSPTELAAALDKIRLHSEQELADASLMPALTGTSRSVWASLRFDFLINDRTNCRVLETIESALLIIHLLADTSNSDGLCIDDEKMANKSVGDEDDENVATVIDAVQPSDSQRRSWFDKSIELYVSTTGCMSFRGELSCCEPEVFASFWNWLQEETSSTRVSTSSSSFTRHFPSLISLQQPNSSSSSNSSSPPPTFSVLTSNTVYTDPCLQVSVSFLRWAMPSAQLSNECEDAFGLQHSLAIDLRVAHCDVDFTDTALEWHDPHDCRDTPLYLLDSLVQLALLLAYLRVHRELPKTRQRVSLRRFRLGRSDFLRPPHSLSWCQAMQEEQQPQAELSRLLKEALYQHRQAKIDVLRGRGFENYLIALKTLSFLSASNPTSAQQPTPSPSSPAAASKFFDLSPFSFSLEESDLLITEIECTNAEQVVLCPPTKTGYAVTIARTGNKQARVFVSASQQDDIPRYPRALVAQLRTLLADMLPLISSASF